MKLFTILLTTFVFFTQNLATAEAIVVRSGEHPAFTRIVLQLPENTGWKVESQEGASKLILDNFSGGFDLRSAFEIIPKTRLTALIAQASELTLQLSCDCPVNAFLEPNRFLVIDIFDGPLIAADIQEKKKSSTLPASAFAYGDLLWETAKNSGNGNGNGAKISNNSIEQDLEQNVVDETDEAITLETQDQLLRSFSNAATRGIIDTKRAIQTEIFPKHKESNANEIFNSSLAEIDIASPISGNIRISNSNDGPNISTPENLTFSGSNCPDPKSVNVSSWGSDTSFSSQFGFSSSLLFDDLGRAQTTRVLAHARLFLFFGFGAEARQTLSIVEGLETDFPELIDLANIMEFGYASNPRFLHQFAGCDTDFALWGILAAEQISEDQMINANAALRALQKLPSHLKFFLAQELNKKLAEHGDIASANIAKRSYSLLEENNQELPKIASAKVDDLRGKSNEAIKILNEIILEDTPEAPEAVISLIQKHVDEGLLVPAEIALLAESFAFELRNSKLSSEMLRAFILSTIKSSQFKKSFQILSEANTRLDNETKVELASLSFSELTKLANDVEFVESYFQFFKHFSPVISLQTSIEVGMRLTKLGFMDETELLVSSFPENYRSDELQIVRAELLKSSGNYLGSLAQLNGLEGVQASRIRGQVLQILGKNQESAENFQTALMADRALSNLWLADDWSTLIDANTPIFGNLTNLDNETPIDFTASELILPNSLAAIQSSSMARSSLETVLDELQISD